MEMQMLLNMVFFTLIAIGSFILRRIFHLFDRLVAEDKELHNRITKVQTTYVSKHDFDQAVERILASLDRVESRINRD